MVVDDDAIVLGTLARLLGELGLQRVAQAASAAEALATLAHERPELIVTDWAMETHAAGLEVVRAAQERGIPVMVLSGSMPDLPPGGRPVVWLPKAELTLARLERELERLRREG